MIFSNFPSGNLRVKVAEYPIIKLLVWPRGSLINKTSHLNDFVFFRPTQKIQKSYFILLSPLLNSRSLMEVINFLVYSGKSAFIIQS